jgi:acyl-CoA synthetase (NDP forming)
VRRNRLCASAEEAAAAFEAIGGPVVVKACSEALPHKTEYGLIYLRLNTANAVREAYQSCVDEWRVSPYQLNSPYQLKG